MLSGLLGTVTDVLLVADVHGASAALAQVASSDEQLLVLGDLINFIDYRTNEGIVAEVCGTDFVAEMVMLRTAGRSEEARTLWRSFSEGREGELRIEYDTRIAAAYEEVCGVLEGSDAIVTFGNVDHPETLQSHLPPGCRFVDSEVVEVEGVRVGVVGGGLPSPLGVPGEVADGAMAQRLAELEPVDVLCTHVAPAVDPLQTDVISGQGKGSMPVLDYLLENQPAFHYFGDIHQPQASHWMVGDTVSRNVGYFRATGRAIRHG